MTGTVMEVEAVRDEAMHLPRRLRAGRATLMVGRSQITVDSRRGPAAREEEEVESIGVALSLSLYLSHTSSRFFWDLGNGSQLTSSPCG
jgi:hypothetical protein